MWGEAPSVGAMTSHELPGELHKTDLFSDCMISNKFSAVNYEDSGRGGSWVRTPEPNFAFAEVSRPETLGIVPKDSLRVTPILKVLFSHIKMLS